MSFDYHSVAGDYQYRAMHSGHPMQRFWHRGKLTMIDLLVKTHLTSDSRLLEIGCGAGNLLLQAVVKDSYPVALDLSRQALTFVRSRLQESCQGADAPCDFVCIQSVSELLPLPDSSFDCIILSEVIEHLEAPQISIREDSIQPHCAVCYRNVDWASNILERSIPSARFYPWSHRNGEKVN